MDRFDGTAAKQPWPLVVSSPATVGRYALHDRIASGGMASVHLGRLQGEGGFARIVAIKRLHPHLGQDPSFVSMFLDEARLVARIRHPNVVPTLDVIAADGEMLLVMEYIAGESLSRLAHAVTTRRERVPPRIVAAVMAGALHGLHAAHEASDERGAPLHIVHRDVSPQNVLVGIDGVARLLDFGVAKARSRLSETRDGELKGKLAYMAPEQLRQEEVDRRTDVYAAGVVLWEALTGQRFHGGEATEASIVERILYGTVQPPTAIDPSLPPALDALVMKALARAPQDRFATARDMAAALEEALGVASMNEVSAWVADVAGTELARRAALVTQVESAGDVVSSRRPTDTAAAVTPTLGFVDDVQTERTVSRGARIGLGVAAGVILLGAFAVARSLAAAAPSAQAAHDAGATADVAVVSGSASSSSVAAPSTTAAVSSAPTMASVAPSPSARPPAAASVRPRPRAGKTRSPSSLPDGLPSDRE